MKKIIFTLVSIMLYGYLSAETNWSKLGGTKLSYSSAVNTVLALGPDGILYVGYKEGGDKGYKMSVCKYENNTWQVVGNYGISPNPVFYPTIAKASDGNLYAAFLDESLKKVYAMQYDGTSWSSLGTAISEGEASFVNIAVDNSNNVYVAYRDHSLSYKACVKKWNGTSWEYVGIKAFSDGPADKMSFALDINGTPHVAFKDEQGAYKLSVMKYNGSSWEYVGERSSSSIVGNGGGQAVSLKFNSQNVAYIAFVNETYSHKACLVKFNGTSWEFIGTIEDDVFSKGEVSFISLAFDNNDVPYVTYRDHSLGYKAFVQKYNGYTWEYVGTDAVTGFSSYASNYNSMGIDNSGNIYVAMTEEGASNNQAFVWKYAATATTTQQTQAEKFNAFKYGEILKIQNASVGELSIYSLSGKCIYHDIIVNDKNTNISLPHGVYFVKNNSTVIKVIL